MAESSTFLLYPFSATVVPLPLPLSYYIIAYCPKFDVIPRMLIPYQCHVMGTSCITVRSGCKEPGKLKRFPSNTRMKHHHYLSSVLLKTEKAAKEQPVCLTERS